MGEKEKGDNLERRSAPEQVKFGKTNDLHTGLTLTAGAKTVTFYVEGEERLRVESDAFYVKGTAVDVDKDEYKRVYEAFRQWVLKLDNFPAANERQVRRKVAAELRERGKKLPYLTDTLNAAADIVEST